MPRFTAGLLLPWVTFAVQLPAPRCAAEAEVVNSFPYKAYAVTDDVQVRSGPGQAYYVTEVLGEGDEVEVYRHDPGGWFAIRPPDGSFSLVPARSVRLLGDGLAEVTGDHVPCRVGTRFADAMDVVQVRLNKGELLEVIGSLELDQGPSGKGLWYKVRPPSGEFRWVFGRLVQTSSNGGTGAAAVLSRADETSAGAGEGPSPLGAPPPVLLSDEPKPLPPASDALAEPEHQLDELHHRKRAAGMHLRQRPAQNRIRVGRRRCRHQKPSPKLWTASTFNWRPCWPSQLLHGIWNPWRSARSCCWPGHKRHWTVVEPDKCSTRSGRLWRSRAVTIRSSNWPRSWKGGQRRQTVQGLRAPSQTPARPTQNRRSTPLAG